MNKLTKKQKMMLGSSLALILVILIAILAITGFGKKHKPDGTNETTATEETTPVETTEETTTVPETTTEPETTTSPEEDLTGKALSPLTGLYVDESIADNRPVAVMINNIKAAIPQSGISYADVIYEAPVEGGITRLMAIFQNYADLTRIGSVRSSRLYYAHIATDYDAIYAHYGQSKYALSFLNSSSIDNLSGTEGVGSTVYFRVSDRKAPHNAYASGNGILAGIKQKGYTSTISDSYLSPLQFLAYDEIANLSGNSAVKVSPGYVNNKPWFEYNAETNTYLRYQFGGSHKDQTTGAQLEVTNIIIQFASASYQDDEYTWDFKMTGNGTGYYITGGKYVPITWIRSSLSATTTFYTEDGKELEMTPGKTWVCVVQNGNKKNVSIQ